MQQYFMQQSLNVGDKFYFDEAQSYHLTKVLRMKNDSIVRVVDGQHHVFLVSLTIQPQVIGQVQKQLDEQNEMACKVTLAQCLIKKEKWEYVLQKSTELGVAKIVGVQSSRTIVKEDERKKGNKAERYQKIVMEAAEQCRRTHIPEIGETISFHQIDQIKSEVNCIAYEDADRKGLSLVEVMQENPKSCTILIGPEGGFSEKEVEEAISKGYRCIHLGKRILRAETASTYALSVIDALSKEEQ